MSGHIITNLEGGAGRRNGSTLHPIFGMARKLEILRDKMDIEVVTGLGPFCRYPTKIDDCQASDP